ncbi:MAG: ribonuclease P protein component 1 [Thermofilaceae archaeon]
MGRSPSNILNHELIGLKVSIIGSRNPSQVGLTGIVVDETMKTLVLETFNGRKRVLKEGTSFLFYLPGCVKLSVNGRELIGRPEDRLKKRTKSW